MEEPYEENSVVQRLLNQLRGNRKYGVIKNAALKILLRNVLF
jgi:hypothetical protein